MNVVPASAKASFLGAAPSVNLTSDTIKVALVRNYTYSAGHQYLSDVTGGGGGSIAATSTALANKTVAGGVFDADDVTFAAVPTGSACGFLVVYKDTGTASTSPLLAIFDSGSGLPVTPNGGDVQIQWSSGASKIFAL